MSDNRVYTLTAQAFSRIMANVNLRINDPDYHRHSRNKLSYLKLILDKGFIPCFKCEQEIPVWSKYCVAHRTLTSIGIRKYYHPYCLESLYI